MSPSVPDGEVLRALVRDILTDLVREALPGADRIIAQQSTVGSTDLSPSIVPTARGSYLPRPAAAVADEHEVDRNRDAPRRSRATRDSRPAVPGGVRVEEVAVNGDDDLQAFAVRLLNLYELRRNRDDVRAGRLRFRLVITPKGLSGAVQPASGSPVRRIERGAVTERQIKAAASAGARVALGRGAVLTPLARERARALGVAIEKEQ